MQFSQLFGHIDTYENNFDGVHVICCGLRG